MEPHKWYGARLADLAELEGITMSKLAAELGLSQSRFSKIRNGEAPFTDAIVETAMDLYDLDASFFLVESHPTEQAAVTFRKRSTAGKMATNRTVRLFREACRVWRQSAGSTNFRKFPIDTASTGNPYESVEDAALAVREADNLDQDAPINNLVRLAERLGIAVIAGLDPKLVTTPADLTADDTNDQSSLTIADHSGMSCPSKYETYPLIATVSPLPGAVQRMTVAHELGHILFDSDLPTSPTARSLEEKRAFNFAAALLLPERMMRKRVSEELTLNAYLRIKANYGVSVGAIILRARNLGLITEQRARSLFIQMNSRGWRLQEPVKVPSENPILFSQCLRRLWPINTVRQVAEQTGAQRALVASWLGETTPTDTTNVVPFKARNT